MKKLRYLPSAALALSLLVTGCGEIRPISTEPGMRIEWPQTLGSACETPGNLSSMDAELWVGGHEPCSLAVESNLSVSGTCDDIRPGIERYVAIAYFLPRTNGRMLLALLVGTIDLTPSTLGDDETTDIDLGEGTFLVTPAELASIPDTWNEEDDVEDRAMAWAKLTASEFGVDLDHDSDTCPNLVEACSGSLETAEAASCD